MTATRLTVSNVYGYDYTNADIRYYNFQGDYAYGPM